MIRSRPPLSLCAASLAVRDFDQETVELDEQLTVLVRQVAPHTLALLEIRPVHAAQLLITAGQNIDRLHGEAAFVTSAQPPRHQPRPGKPPATGSIPAAIATPTAPCT